MVVATTLNEFQGHLDIWSIMLSAIGLPMPFARLPVGRFPNRINLIALFLLIAMLPAMIENGGSIINVTSDAGVTGYPLVRMVSRRTRGSSQPWAAELEDS